MIHDKFSTMLSLNGTKLQNSQKNRKHSETNTWNTQTFRLTLQEWLHCFLHNFCVFKVRFSTLLVICFMQIYLAGCSRSKCISMVQGNETSKNKTAKHHEFLPVTESSHKLLKAHTLNCTQKPLNLQ